MTDLVYVATSGRNTNRSDICKSCGGPMLYYVPNEVPLAMFCDSFGCPDWLKEIKIAGS